jgi:V8-like Glu-specific endopeptidase
MKAIVLSLGLGLQVNACAATAGDFSCVGDLVDVPSEANCKSGDRKELQQILSVSRPLQFTSTLRIETKGLGVCTARFVKGSDSIGLLTRKNEYGSVPIPEEGETAFCIFGQRTPRTDGTLKCTATWVGTDLVVTAKHCIAGGIKDLLWLPAFDPIPESGPTNYQGPRFDVEKVVYQSDDGGGDLALLAVQFVGAPNVPRQVLKPLPLSSNTPKPPHALSYFGHLLGGALVGVAYRDVLNPGPKLLTNWVSDQNHHKIEQMFCASSDQANGGSGGPFLDATTGSIVGVLWGGDSDWEKCPTVTGACLMTFASSV